MMIENERQYCIRKAQAQKFAQAIAKIEHSYSDVPIHPLLRKAEQAALQSQMESLNSEIREYEDLRAGEAA